MVARLGCLPHVVASPARRRCWNIVVLWRPRAPARGSSANRAPLAHSHGEQQAMREFSRACEHSRCPPPRASKPTLWLARARGPLGSGSMSTCRDGATPRRGGGELRVSSVRLRTEATRSPQRIQRLPELLTARWRGCAFPGSCRRGPSAGRKAGRSEGDSRQRGAPATLPGIRAHSSAAPARRRQTGVQPLLARGDGRVSQGSSDLPRRLAACAEASASAMLTRRTWAVAGQMLAGRAPALPFRHSAALPDAAWPSAGQKTWTRSGPTPSHCLWTRRATRWCGSTTLRHVSLGQWPACARSRRGQQQQGVAWRSPRVHGVTLWRVLPPCGRRGAP